MPFQQVDVNRQELKSGVTLEVTRPETLPAKGHMRGHKMRYVLPVELVFESDIEVEYAAVQRSDGIYLTYVMNGEAIPPLVFDPWMLREKFLRLETAPQSSRDF